MKFCTFYIASENPKKTEPGAIVINKHKALVLKTHGNL